MIFPSENDRRICIALISFNAGLGIGLATRTLHIELDGSDLIALGAALVALVALIRQVRENNKQSKMQTFLTYTQRYQDVLVNLPIEIESPKFEPSSDQLQKETMLRWLRAYFDLCSEQYYLHSRELIEDAVWNLWKGGIQDYLRKPAFKWAWETIQDNDYYHGKFAGFIDEIIEKNA